MSIIQAVKASSGGEKIWLAVIAIAAVVLYHRTLAYCWHAWQSQSQYSLAFLVPFVSGYFTWAKWPQVVSTPRSPSRWGPARIGTAFAMHLAGTLLDISGPSSVSMLVFLVGCCLYLHGPGLVRTLSFPLAYLVFAVPVPGGVTDIVGFPLQLWASGATAVLLRAVGVAVTRSGVNLSVGGFDLQVAEPCSGMRSLVALVGVAALFAYLTRLRPAQKWALFFLAVPIALAANVFRIATIALVGLKWGTGTAMGVYHTWSSPILFFMALLLLFLINRGMEWLNTRADT